MRIWISKNSEVPVSDQLATQIELAVAAGDFHPGDKLPSTREVARRCGVHANTVGAVYRRLAGHKLLEFRQGSGFYVSDSAEARLAGVRRLDELLGELLRSASELGFGRDDVLERLRNPVTAKPPESFVLIESDDGLAEIIAFELGARSVPVTRASLEDVQSLGMRQTTLFVAMFDERLKIESLLRDDQHCFYLKGNSVSAALSRESRPEPDDLIAVVSGWDGFLTFARIMLLAAKIDPGNLIVRSTADEDWLKSVSSASMLICDSLTANTLSGLSNVRSFRVVADESISELHARLRSRPAS